MALIFPAWADPFWPQHTDFYMPTEYRNGGVTFFAARPVGTLVDFLRGYAGIRGSIAVAFGVVVLNVSIIGTLISRLRAEIEPTAFLICFCLFSLSLFTHPYFYTFAFEDFYSQLSLLILLLGALFFGQSNDIRGLVALAAFFLIGFLAKETYFLSSLAIIAGVPIIGSKRGILKRSLCLAGICIAAFSIAFSLNRFAGSQFVSGSHVIGSPYFISLNPISLANQWASYLNDGVHVGLLVSFAAVLVLPYFSSAAARISALSLIAGLLAWLPNSVLPNHHSEGYSWNGAYFLSAPLLFVSEFFRNIRLRWVVIAILGTSLVFISVASQTIANRAGNTWNLIQIKIARNFLTDLSKLLRDPPAAITGPVFLTGVIYPFSPMDRPMAIEPELKLRDVALHVVAYGGEIHQPEHPSKLVSWVADSEIGDIEPEQVWVSLSNGQIEGARHFLARGGARASEICKANALLYPDLINVVLSSVAPDEAYSLRECGAQLIRYSNFSLAERVLCRSLELRADDAYTWFFLGRALESQLRPFNYVASRAVKLDDRSAPNAEFLKLLNRSAKPKDRHHKEDPLCPPARENDD